jgi:hypothetical protein
MGIGMLPVYDSRKDKANSSNILNKFNQTQSALVHYLKKNYQIHGLEIS